MTIKQFKLWYMDNKENVLKLSTKYINHRILIVDDKNNEYKYIRRGTEARIIPREKMKSKQQIIDDLEQLKTIFKELEFMEDKLRHYGDLLIMKGIDVEQPREHKEEQTDRNKDKRENKTEFVNFGPV